jgi:hypothetical protein
MSPLSFVEHFLIFSAFVLFYRGILLFFRSPRTTHVLWMPCTVALLLLAYFSVVEDRLPARIVIVSVVLFFCRGLIAVELFRQASQRPILNVFAVLMATYALFGWSVRSPPSSTALRTISCRPATPDPVARSQPFVHLHHWLVLSADAQ